MSSAFASTQSNLTFTSTHQHTKMENTTFGENVTLVHIGDKLVANDSIKKTFYLWDSNATINLSSNLTRHSQNMDASGYFIFAIGLIGFIGFVFLIYYTIKSPSFRSELLQTAPERIHQVYSAKSCKYHARYYPETSIGSAVNGLEDLTEFSNEFSDNQQSYDIEKLIN